MTVVAAPAITTWKIDPVHSNAQFKVKHMMISNVKGEFTALNGSLEFDNENIANSQVEAAIDATSISTRDPQRDAHLKSADFFDVEKFPALTFKSTKVAKQSGGELQVTGDLTIHGVTKSITVKIAMTGTGKDMKGNPVIGFESTFTVNRNDFGIKEFPGVLGDDVTFTISLEGDKK